jgi:hypothetical protein
VGHHGLRLTHHHGLRLTPHEAQTARYMWATTEVNNALHVGHHGGK